VCWGKGKLNLQDVLWFKLVRGLVVYSLNQWVQMKHVSFLLLTSIAGSVIFLFAADRGTPAEAKAMLEKAVDHYKAVGRKQALADFNAKKSPFYDRDLYVVCFDSNRTILANGAFPQYVGVSADMLKDAHGNSVGRQGWEVARKSGQGSVQYDWINPMTHRTEPKVTFFAKAGDDVCGVGAYNPK
jgi:cytochrome c